MNCRHVSSATVRTFGFQCSLPPTRQIHRDLQLVYRHDVTNCSNSVNLHSKFFGCTISSALYGAVVEGKRRRNWEEFSVENEAEVRAYPYYVLERTNMPVWISVSGKLRYEGGLHDCFPIVQLDLCCLTPAGILQSSERREHGFGIPSPPETRNRVVDTCIRLG